MTEDPTPTWYLLQFLRSTREQLKAGAVSREEVIVHLLETQHTLQQVLDILIESQGFEIVIVPETWTDPS